MVASQRLLHRGNLRAVRGGDSRVHLVGVSSGRDEHRWINDGETNFRGSFVLTGLVEAAVVPMMFFAMTDALVCLLPLIGSSNIRKFHQIVNGWKMPPLAKPSGGTQLFT
ncbi:hypothetical protein L1049_027678 [Liquidambar formosana]|uniref:Uncharacterized protein n=1 Tax=Liquidambar formosana TaxID=63359 RepID=A0AAP0RJK9_LIQFO